MTAINAIKDVSAPTTELEERFMSSLGDALESLKKLQDIIEEVKKSGQTVYPDTLAESVAEALSDTDDALCGEGWEATR